MIELYELAISGNSHKVRLMLSLLGIDYKSYMLNMAERDHKKPEFLALNPFGQVPLLKDGNIVLRDSQAILVYLARAYGEEHWFPNNPVKAAEISGWLSVAANEITRGPSALRAHYKIGRAINLDEAVLVTNSLLHILNTHLEGRDWLVAEQVTIADVAVYPYIALANEGKVELSPYTYVKQWLGRFENLEGFVSMEGISLQV